jgi:hypothetical protein
MGKYGTSGDFSPSLRIKGMNQFDLDGLHEARSAPRPALRVVIVVCLLLTAVALGTAGWRYRYLHAREVERTRSKQPPQPASAIAVLSPSSSANDNESPEHAAPPQPSGTASEVEISVHPMEQFRDDLKKTLVQRLATIYPGLPDLNREAAGPEDPAYRDSVFQFLNATEKASETQQPAMLLAADFMLQAVWCPSEKKAECDELRKRFAEHKLTLANSELGGGWYYQHDLLWRVWQQFPTTEWGERAFVLLLDFGWDTSGMCTKGSDQFREVIHQGESFLEQHPSSPYRDHVSYLVARAYATWWSLSQQPTSAMADYVDPKLYQEGAEQARLKALQYFEQLETHSPEVPLGEYARQFLPVLRECKLIVDSYRFLCVYD